MKYKRWNKKDCSIQKIWFQSHYLKEAYDIYYSLLVFIGIVNENSFIYLSQHIEIYSHENYLFGA